MLFIMSRMNRCLGAFTLTAAVVLSSWFWPRMETSAQFAHRPLVSVVDADVPPQQSTANGHSAPWMVTATGSPVVSTPTLGAADGLHITTPRPSQWNQIGVFRGVPSVHELREVGGHR